VVQKEAIFYSWDLLTRVYKLPKDRLYVTYFEGDPKNSLEPDLEAKEFWIQQGVPQDHILPGNAKDNFWGEDTKPQMNTLVFDPSLGRDGSSWSVRSVQVSLKVFVCLSVDSPITVRSITTG
jgi:hypothetical protein